MIAFKKSRSAVFAGCLLAALTAAAPASAGGFAVREQSAEFQGMSFAGDAAAGGGLSGMFWNPAVAGYAPKGYSSESDAAGIFGHVNETATVGPGLLALPADSGNIAPPALVPGSYTAYRISPQAVLALSINSPFGLTTKVASPWAGQTLERTSVIRTYDYVPTIAYTLAPGLSLGAGLQIEQIDAHLTGAFGYSSASPLVTLDGNDTAVGYSLGINWNPSPQASIGLGYKSAVTHNLSGTDSISSAPVSNAVTARLTLPEIVTLSARQMLTDKARLTGTIEWTGWHRLQQFSANCSVAGPPFCSGAGATATGSTIPLNWHDSWMFALGGEYDFSRQLTLRTGAAYELSPIQNPDERTPRLPDQNRFWLSGGASYKLNEMIGVDVAYSHIWGLGGGIEVVDALGQPFAADVSSSVDIVSAALKFKLNP